MKFWKRPCQTEKIITNQRYNTRLIINREKKTSHTLSPNYFLRSNEMYSGKRQLLERHTFSSYEYPFTSGVRTQKLLDISITIQYTLSKLAGKLLLHFAIYALIILWISQCLHIEKCPKPNKRYQYDRFGLSSGNVKLLLTSLEHPNTIWKVGAWLYHFFSYVYFLFISLLFILMCAILYTAAG